jgi:BirA family biotin operon repressor/biotin-[acetyl-CoA-carboxylase] ligase
MNNLELTAAEVRRYLREAELPRRRAGVLGGFADEIIRYGSFVGSSIDSHTRLERAMEHGRQHIDSTEKRGESVQSGRIILADTLTGSKGRFTRSWHAPEGGLWGCLIHANTLTPQSTMLLSLAVGIAACESICREGPDKTFIRWVNDVLIDGAKVAGFLIESHTGPKWKEVFHLIGFGINVNNGNFPAELADIAVSLQESTGRRVDLRAFTLDFIAKLAWNIGLLYFVEARETDWLEEPHRFCHPLLERWRELSDTLGKKVLFGYDVLSTPQYSATVTGIAYDGGLKMVLDDGLAITEHSGEVRYL